MLKRIAEFWRQKTGIRVNSYDSLVDALEKVSKFPFWKSKTVFICGNIVFSGTPNIPKNVTLELTMNSSFSGLNYGRPCILFDKYGEN